MIRLVETKDIDQLIPLVKAFYDESLSKYGFPMSEEVVKATIEHHIKNESGLVLEIDNKVVGTIAGQFVELMGSGQKVFQEVIWYVLPEYRKYGLKLFDETEEHCKRIGMSAIIMGYMGNLNCEKMDRFYKRHGYEPLEVQWIKKL